MSTTTDFSDLYVGLASAWPVGQLVGFLPGTTETVDVQTTDGEGFRAYGGVFTAFGGQYIVGHVSGTINVELYRFVDDYTVELFADIRVGEEASFFRDIRVAGTLDGQEFLTGEARISSDVYEDIYLLEDGTIGLLENLPERAELYSYSSSLFITRSGAFTLLENAEGDFVPFILDDEIQEFTPFATFAPDVPEGLSFLRLYEVNGQLRAHARAENGDRVYLDLDANGVWQDRGILSDWGRTYEFSFNGYDYFSGNSSEFGIELWRLADDGTDFELVSNSNFPTNNSFLAIQHFEIGGQIYFYSNSGNFSNQLFAINQQNQFVEILADSEEAAAPFGILFDFGDFSVKRLFDGILDGSPNYVLLNDTLTEFDLPDGTLLQSFILDGVGYLHYRDTVNGETTQSLWAVGQDASVVQVLEVGDGERIIDAMSADHVWNGRRIYVLEGQDDIVRASDLGSVVITNDGNDSVTGGASGDIIWGGGGRDSLLGHGGDDTIDGGSGSDLLDGLSGADSVSGGFGLDTLYGGDGNDTLSGDGNADRLYGEAGDDGIWGGQGPDNLWGGDGNDTLHGGSEADRIDGGEGDDFIRAGSNFGSSVDGVNGGAGNDTIFGDAGFDLLLGGDGEDSIDGGGQADNIFGDAGNDTLLGGGGFDRLFGGAGDDLIEGQQGTDALFGSFGDDTLNGGTERDRFFGGADNDILNGEEGNDELLGGGGFDTLNGGTGDDRLLGNFNADTFVFEDGHGNDTIADFDEFNQFEKIDLSAVTTIHSLADLDLGSDTEGAATQAGANVLITTSTGNTILVQNVLLADLDSNDFAF